MSQDYFPVFINVGPDVLVLKAELAQVSGTADSLTVQFHSHPDRPNELPGEVRMGGEKMSLAAFLNPGGNRLEQLSVYLPKDPYKLPRCKKCGGRTFRRDSAAHCRPAAHLHSFYCHALGPVEIDAFENRWAAYERHQRQSRVHGSRQSCPDCDSGAPGPCPRYPACQEVR